MALFCRSWCCLALLRDVSRYRWCLSSPIPWGPSQPLQPAFGPPPPSFCQGLMNKHFCSLSFLVWFPVFWFNGNAKAKSLRLYRLPSLCPRMQFLLLCYTTTSPFPHSRPEEEAVEIMVEHLFGPSIPNGASHPSPAAGGTCLLAKGWSAKGVSKEPQACFTMKILRYSLKRSLCRTPAGCSMLLFQLFHVCLERWKITQHSDDTRCQGKT